MENKKKFTCRKCIRECTYVESIPYNKVYICVLCGPELIPEYIPYEQHRKYMLSKYSI